MKNLLIILFLLFTQSVLSQSIGYEVRTNNKSYQVKKEKEKFHQQIIFKALNLLIC